MAFEPFNLGQVLANAQQLKSMQDNATLAQLQRQYLGQRMTTDAAAETRAATQFTQEQQLSNTKLLNMAAAEVAQNPASAARWDPVLKAAIPDWSGVQGDPAQIQAGAKALFESTSKALQAYRLNSEKNQTPAELQTFAGMTRGLSPQDVEQARRVALGIASRAGQSRVTMVGNVPTLVGVGDDNKPFQIPLSTLAGEAQGHATVAGAEAGAKTTATGQAERALEMPQAQARLAATNAKFDRLSNVVQEVLDDPNLWKAVGLGRGLSMIPGSAGADLKAKIENIQSQAGLAVLQDMRDNSKSGGAVGQVSNFEQQIFQNNIANLGNLNQSPENFRAQLMKLKAFAEGSKERFGAAFSSLYPGISGPSSTGGASGQQGMTEEQYNALPSGAQYSAPDGTTRTKR